MQQFMQQPNQGLPDIIRVQALKGFRGRIDGNFGIANPGDVVEVEKLLAMELRSAGKAVMSEKPLGRVPQTAPAATATSAPEPIAALTRALDAHLAVLSKLLAKKD